MDNDKTAIRFTDEMYAGKADVQKELNSALIDSVWDRIINYRAQYTHELPLRMVTRDPLRIVLTPRIADNINRAGIRLAKLSRNFFRYSRFSASEDEFRRQAQVNILRFLASFYGLKTNDTLLYNVVDNNVSAVRSEELILLRYKQALLQLVAFGPIVPDLSHFVTLYFSLDGGAVNDIVFRTEEIQDSRENAQINPIFIHAPVSRIEDMLLALFENLSNPEIPLLIKLSAALFYGSYIFPFSYHSEEMTILLAKMVLAGEDYDDIASFLPLEILLSSDKEAFDEACLLTKKTGDLTYVIAFVLPTFTHVLDQFAALLAEFDKKALLQERYIIDEDVAKAHNQARGEISEQTHLAGENSTFPERQNDERLTGNSSIAYDVKLAMEHLPVGLDEDDAHKLEQHLLELDPGLKKAEAYFYARHCTIGKFYTIAQFRKLIGCAYETARTSMDRLSSSGYYRKEQLKNKFIYTPIPRRA